MATSSDVVARALARRRANPTHPLQILPRGSGRTRLDRAGDGAGKSPTALGVPITRVQSLIPVLCVPVRPAARPLSRPVLRQHYRPDARERGAGRPDAQALQVAAGAGVVGRRGERGHDLVHGHVRPGARDAGEQFRSHPPDPETDRRNRRADADRAPLGEWPPEFFRVDDNIRRRETCSRRWSRAPRSMRHIARGPQGMMDEMKRSNLRGRGGAGFPTGTKFEGERNAPGRSGTSSATPTRASRGPSRTASS